MKAAHCTALAAGLAIAAAAWAADIDLKGFAARVPALPASSAAAATNYPATSKNWATMPDKPAAFSAFQQDLLAASMKANATSMAAPGAAPAAAYDPAAAQAMAARMQTMSQTERMAYAMQMQQQMTSGMSRPQAAIVSPAEGQALKQLTAEQQAASTEQIKYSALKASDAKFLSDWEQADDAITHGPGGDRENLGSGGGTDFVCSESERSARLAAYALHVKLANAQLAKAAALDQQQRANIDSALGRYDRVQALGAQIKNPAMSMNVISARNVTMNNAVTVINERADINDQAGRRAALWQHLNDNVRKLPAVDCKGGSG